MFTSIFSCGWRVASCKATSTALVPPLIWAATRHAPSIERLGPVAWYTPFPAGLSTSCDAPTSGRAGSVNRRVTVRPFNGAPLS